MPTPRYMPGKHARCSLFVMAASVASSACSLGDGQHFHDGLVPLFVAINDYDPANTDTVYAASVSPDAALRKTHNMAPVAAAAIEVTETDSAVARQVTERRLDLNALRWEALPELNLNAALQARESDDSEISADDAVESYRVGLEQKLFDFGRHAAQAQSARVQLSQANVERWQEHNQSVFDALEQLTELYRHQRLFALSEEYLVLNENLRSIIRTRFRGGVSDRSERSLVELRQQEIALQRQTDELALQAAATELEFQTAITLPALKQVEPVAVIDVFESVPDPQKSPSVIIAELGVSAAMAERRERQSRVLPSLVVEAFSETTAGEESSGVELRLDSEGFAGFGYLSQQRAASALVETARSELAFSRRVLSREFDRLALENNNLGRRKQALQEQMQWTEQSRDLFFEQFKAGVKPVVEAIRIYEGALDLARQLVNVEADLTINRLNGARIHGLLAEYPQS